MIEVLRTAEPTARKLYRCEDCGGLIPAGTRYHRQVCVDAGRVYGWVTCLPCRDLLDYVWDWAGQPYDEGVGPDTYAEWAEEAVHSDDPVVAERAAQFLARANSGREGP